MRLYRPGVLLTLLILLSCHFLVAQTVLYDDFTRTNNSTVGNGWQEVETQVFTAAQLAANQLRLGSGIAGRDYVYKDVSAAYNTVYNSNAGVLTWAFNMRQSRADPSGFDASNYGATFVIGCNTNDFNNGSGYAIVLGNSGSADNLRLVRFTNGLDGNSNLTNIIAPAVDYGNHYLTVKVTYNPSGDEWSLYIGSNLTVFDNPLTAAYSQLGASVSDGTYTGNDLMYLGAYWNHATGTSELCLFDNIRIPNLCAIVPSPTINASNLTASSVGANSIQLDWTRGDGSLCIIVGKQPGPVTGAPGDGASYFANATFGLGSQVAPGEYVVYSGSGSTTIVNGLNPTTAYEFRIFEYNGSGCMSNYLSTTPGIVNLVTTACIPATEPSAQPSAPVIVSGLTSSIQLAWTRGNGDYCIVTGKASGPVTAIPSDGSSYIAGSVFGTGSALTVDEYVLYIGTGNTVTVTGLLSSTTYHFKIFEFSGTGCNSNYATVSPATITGTTSAVAAYNLYFGNLHSHSDYSDGDMDNVCNGPGSAYCCYDIGNTALNFDFMGIADHNHNEGPVITPAKYASGLAEADNYNSTHADFTALYGMEWGTISTGGHVCVYGIDQLIGWNAGNYDIYCAKGDYNTLFNKVSSTPGAFATLCHPNYTDFGNIAGTPYNATYDNAIVGVALKNGPYNSLNTTYTDPAAGNNANYYKVLLSKGYHLGPTVDLDNHNSATMGKSSQGRTVILAPSLSKATLNDAMLNMRFYATEDYNLNVTFTINNVHHMGSIVSGTTSPVLKVTTSDPDGEATTLIRIWFGVPGSNLAPGVLLSQNNVSTATAIHGIVTGTFYYFAEIVQADGNITWTSPVWYNKLPSPLPIELLSFTGKSTPGGNLLEWITATELNNEFFQLERSADGTNFEIITSLPGAGTSLSANEYRYLDVTAPTGKNYYRLKQVDYDGQFSYSDIILITTVKKSLAFSIHPNPSDGTFVISAGNDLPVTSIYIYDITGRSVNAAFVNFDNKCVVTIPEFSNGIYSIHAIAGEKIFTSKISLQKN